MQALLISVRYLIFMTILLGVAYPLLVMGIGQITFPIRSNGSLVKQDSVVIGSELLAQKFERQDMFWTRPSATDYNPAASGASNQSGTSTKLKVAYENNALRFGKDAPSDLLFASGSGVDPHISVEAARFQKSRIMANRKVDEKILDGLISKATEERFLGFMGQPRVNVLKLNLLLANLKQD